MSNTSKNDVIQAMLTVKWFILQLQVIMPIGSNLNCNSI